MKIFLSNLLEYDLFGVNLKFTYLKKEKYGSFFSLTLSLILVTICVSKIIIHSIKLINKQDLEFKVYETSNINDTIKLVNLSLHICPKNKFDINTIEIIELYSDNKTLNNSTDPFIKCENKYINMSCICFKYNDSYYEEINSVIDFKEKGIYIELDFSKTNIEFFDFTILTNKTYIDLQNFEEKFKSYEEYYDFQVRPGKYVEIEFLIDKLNVESSNDILSFGIFGPQISTYTNFTIGQFNLRSYNIQNKEKEHQKERIDILFRHSRIIKTFSVISFSIEHLLSQLGGYIQIMTFIFTFLGQNYNMLSLNKTIKKGFDEKLKNFINDQNNKDNMNDIKFTYKDSSDIRNNKLSEKFFELKILDETFVNKSNLNLNNNYKVLINDLVDEFHNLFDFQNLYETFKEIKLLKYLLLNPTQTQFIETNKKYPIDFRKEKIFNLDGSYTT